MRSLGEFFGHIAHGVKTPAPSSTSAPASSPDPNRRVVRQSVEEEERVTPQGKVVLRRTVIEEVELPRPSPDAAGRPDDPSPDQRGAADHSA